MLQKYVHLYEGAITHKDLSSIEKLPEGIINSLYRD